MAYIVSQTTEQYSAAASVVPALLSHQTDDIIYLIATNDGGGTAISTATSGWTVYDPGSASGGTRAALLWKRAASGSETAPTIAGANDEWIVQQFIIRDVDTTTAIDFTPEVSAWNAVSFKASPAATSATDDALIIYSFSADGAQKMRHKLSEAVYLDNWRDQSNAIASLVCYRQMGTAGSVPTVTMYAINANEGGHAWVIGFRNKSGGSLQPMPVVDCDEIRWYGDYGATHDATTTWGDLQDAGPTTINSIAVSSTAPTVTASVQTGFESTPNGSSTDLSRNTNLGSDEWVGGAHAITPMVATGKTLTVSWVISNIAFATLGSEGMILVLGDSGGGWVAYQLSKRQDSAALFPYFNQIVVGASTEYDSSGTFDSDDWAWVGYAYHRRAGSATNIAIRFKNLMLFTDITLIGGGASSPVSPSVITNAMNAEWMYRNAEKQGAAQTLAKCKVLVGDGSSKCYYDATATALELPGAYDAATNRYVNVDPLALEFRINAAASNTIKPTAALMGAGQAQPLVIDSSSSTSATYDFSGTPFVGWNATWKTGVPCSGATFTDGGKIDFKGATVTNTVVSGTTSTAAPVAFTATGGSMTGCTTDVTGTGAAYHIEVGDGGTGNFALTLANHTFTGTAGTDKVHVTNTSGTTTINISGTTTLLSGDVTSEGATVVIASDPVYQSAVASGFTAGSRIQIYDTTNNVELFNGTASAGDTVVSGGTATWTDPTPAAGSRAIRVRKAYVNGASAEVFEEYSGLTCGTTAETATVTYPISPVSDATYNTNAIDGSTITDVTFTDASPDRVNVDKAGGALTYPQLYAAFVYWMSTATGIADDFAYIQAPDTANYIFTAMKIRNTSATPLTLTGGYGRDATSGLVADIIDVAGSTGNIYPQPDHVVAFATGSGVTAQDKIDIANQTLTAAASAPIAANVKQMNDATVVGTGIASDLWRGGA